MVQRSGSKVRKKKPASPSPRRTAPRQAARPSVRSSGRVRILLADNQLIDRAGLTAVLQTQPDFEVVGEAADAVEAGRLSHDLRPSVTVLALQLPAPAGRTALSYIRAHAPDIPILAVAERGRRECMVLNPPRHGSEPREPHERCATGTDCLELAVSEGATGTIRRDADPEELYRAIRTVASGKAWYEVGTAAAIMRHALGGERAYRNLSSRETEVAELIANGRSNKEIAQALGITDTTVKKHVGQILAKLKLQDRLQVGLYVARNPLVLRLHDASSR